MRLSTVLVLACAIVAASAARPLNEVREGAARNGYDYAVLIAGSNTWGNYRHQADIFHSYQILVNQGMDPSRIVTIAFNDIANSPENPHPGQVINNPQGKDVFAGVAIDYQGADVSAETVLAVLAGDTASLAGKGTGRALASGPDDHVFVYYADHGGPGILGMPQGMPFLYAKDLTQTLITRANNQGFAQMTFYLEACESGSIFKGLLPDNVNIYAVTAANDHESSWGYYCPGMTPAPPSEYNTCLGDLFSISWLENADVSDLTTETLETQFEKVKVRTSNHGTYQMGSHVMRFGDYSIANETCADFMGNSEQTAAKAKFVSEPTYEVHGNQVPQRDANLHSLWYRHMTAPENSPEKAALRTELLQEMTAREQLDTTVEQVVTSVAGMMNSLTPVSETVSDVMTAVPEGAVVEDWDCFKGMIAAFEKACGPLSEYGMKHTRSFANLCNRHVSPATVGNVAANTCAKPAGMLLRPVEVA